MVHSHATGTLNHSREGPPRYINTVFYTVSASIASACMPGWDTQPLLTNVAYSKRTYQFLANTTLRHGTSVLTFNALRSVAHMGVGTPLNGGRLTVGHP